MGRDRLLLILSFAVIYFVWGATYLANYWAIDSIPVFAMGGSRFLTAGALLYGYTLLRGDRTWPRPTYLVNSAIIGVILLGIGTAAVVWAQQYVPTSTTSLLIAFEPLLVMLLMWSVLRERPGSKAFLGAFISISGMALLITQPVAIGGGDAYVGLLAIFFGMLCWASGMLLRQRLDIGPNAVRSTSLQMLSAGTFLLLLSPLLDDYSDFSLASITTKSAYSWLFLVFFGSILAFSAFNYLLARVSADKVATNNYVNPVVAVFLGAAFNDEVVTVQSIVAGAILLAGVYFINTAKT